MDIYKEIEQSFRFFEPEKYPQELVDCDGDPLLPVSTKTFNHYLIYVTHLINKVGVNLPCDVNLCPNRSIDLSIVGSERTPHLLINIKEDIISYYGFSHRERIPNEKYGYKYHNVIEDKTTSSIPCVEVVNFLNKYLKAT